MANGKTHSFAGGLTGLAVGLANPEIIKKDPKLLLAAPIVGTFFGKLPDILEPAFKNPHHRQFFHSLAFVGMVGYGTKKVYDWNPEDNLEKAIRLLLLCASAGYLSHLVLDAATPRSLPLVGRL
jgi:membrane-bound metal-dependent hydrolase YbcI (DUF457 family)